MDPFPYTETDVLLKVDNVSLTLGGRKILDGVNAEIRDIVRPGMVQGQVVCLLGPSGIGKTQLFRVMAGLEDPTAGKVLITSKQVPVERGIVGVVAQNYPLFEHRTVMGNLVVAGKQVGLSKKVAEEKGMEILRRFSLEERYDFYPAQLSGGQRQRIAIAQQLLCSEKFLLMDEPFSGLDPLMVDEVCRLINEVAMMDEQNTIIVVTHDITAAILVADTLWIMGRNRNEKGEVISGAKITSVINLISRGLTWHKNIAQTPEFAECVRDVRALFPLL